MSINVFLTLLRRGIVESRTQAISEFKEKLKERLCMLRFSSEKRCLEQCMNCRIIDKTAQEIK
jgi:hypothetical protein